MDLSEKKLSNKRFFKNKTGFTGIKKSDIIKNKISLLFKIKVALSNFHVMFGIIFIVSSLTCAFLVSYLDTLPISKDQPLIEGEITSINETNKYKDGRLIYEYNYIFETPDNVTYTDKSYYNELQTYTDNKVMIRYTESNPDKSCIIGMDKETTPWWVFILMLGPAFVGIVDFIIGMKKVWRNIRILKFGKVSFGTYKSSNLTNAETNSRDVYKYYFDFIADDNNTYTATGETHMTERLEDEEKEPVIYNSKNPSEAVILDTLPVIIRQFFNDRIQMNQHEAFITEIPLQQNIPDLSE